VSAEDRNGWRRLILINMPTADGGVYAFGPIQSLIRDWQWEHAPSSWYVGFVYTTFYAIHRRDSRMQIGGDFYPLSRCQIVDDKKDSQKLSSGRDRLFSP
jgi:hypothetical protein